MRLCLSCHRLWPRDALFCGGCARSFGGRLCSARHLSPASAHVCVQCGRDDLSEPTAFLSLSWLSTLLSAVCLLLIWKWSWRHLTLVYAGFLDVVNCLLRLLFDAPPHALERLVSQGLAWTVCIVVALHLLPGRTGRDVRRTVYASMRRLAQLTGGILVVQLIRRLFAACRRSRRAP